MDPLSLFRLDSRIVIVTGASAGLGARFARVLHGAGATVVMAARRLDRLEALAAELPGSVAMACDVADSAQRERLIADTVARFGRIDVLVNNAGVGYKVAIEDETLDDFRNTMEVNVTAVWHLSKLAGEHMVRQRSGSIINLGSVLGFVGSTPVKQTHYVASKGAVINMTKEMALQWARRGVRVNALCPGWFPSEMTEGMDTEEGGLPWVRANSPIPRFGEEHELDGPLLLLASDASSFMTGTTVVVDGGWLAR
jgi:NAD(P)-dependent dehydrogenase (short-subunit alcohol dehydrogenase family)